jgi:ribosomal protein S6--L-glutamate ligase
MRIAVLVVRHPASRPSPIIPEMLRELARRGCAVDVLTPDEGVLSLAEQRPEEDFYVLKSGTESALSLAGFLHHRGARIVNPYPVAVACRDKIVQTPLLQAAGLPVPASWLTVHPGSLAPLLDDGPVIVKAPRGSQGRGITVARRPDDLAALPAGLPWLAMRYHAPDGPDLKLYRIGEEVFGVRRSFPARTYEEKLGNPFEVPTELRELVLRCGEVFGISLYGVDVIFSDGRPWVVDMSSFPGFKGVPRAGVRLAEYLLAEGPAIATRAAA